jgi:hypothetical protein
MTGSKKMPAKHNLTEFAERILLERWMDMKALS